MEIIIILVICTLIYLAVNQKIMQFQLITIARCPHCHEIFRDVKGHEKNCPKRPHQQ